MMVTYHSEQWTDVWPEMQPILEGEHLPEARDDEGLIPRVNTDYMEALEWAGLLHCVTARDEGTLIGYHVAACVPPFNFQGAKSAQVLFYYVDKAYRGRRIMTDMLACAETLLRMCGIDYVWSESKIGHRGLFERAEWKATATTYMKKLGE